ncbi:MAG: glycosyltransferase [Flavobacteriales bacterium]|nr:glycosyltransferase [Flavobacteriales bacterium]
MQKLAVIIPCYNEENRLDFNQVRMLLQNKNLDVYFANDGSTDKTLEKVLSFKQNNNFDNLHIINYTINRGKGKTLYLSFLEILNTDKYSHLGFLDADFATKSQDFLKMVDYIQENKNYSFIFGSRVKTLNTKINRNFARHLVGRVLITVLNLKFKLGIYDTQCGAKIFSSELLNHILDKSLITNWLFDIELFIRLKKINNLNLGKEFILDAWEDKANSKITSKESFKILKEIVKLYVKY